MCLKESKSIRKGTVKEIDISLVQLERKKWKGRGEVSWLKELDFCEWSIPIVSISWCFTNFEETFNWTSLPFLS